MHLFSTVMHCGASFLDCDALYNNTPRDKSELRCQPGALHLVVELQFELSAMVIARQRKSLCNGAQCAMVHNAVQCCTVHILGVECAVLHILS